MNSRKIIIATFLIYGLGMLYRLFSLFPPEPTIDLTAFAVQALRVLQGETPIFYYGQKFMGTGGVYLIALFYKIFGISYFTLGFFGFVTMGFTLFFTVLLALRFFGPWCGFWTAVLISVPARMMFEWAHVPNPDYAFTFLLAPVLLILCHKLILLSEQKEEECGKKRYGLFALTGLISGFGMWNNLQLGTCVVWTFFIFLCYYRLRLFRYFWAYCFCFCIGFLPEIYANLTMDFFIFKMGALEGVEAVSHKVYLFFTKALPFFWGWENIAYMKKMTTGWIFFQTWLGMVYLLCMGLVLSKKTDSRFKKGAYIAFGFLGYHLFVNFITIFGNRFGHEGFPTPYIQVLYGVSLVVVASVISSPVLPKKLRTLLALPVFIYLGHNLQCDLPHIEKSYAYVLQKGGEIFSGNEMKNKSFLEFFREKNLEGGYMEEAVLNQVRFETRNRILLSSTYQEAYFPDSIRTDACKKIFWGCPYSFSFDENLEYLGCRYEFFKGEGALSAIYYDFRKKAYPAERLLEGYEFTAAVNTLNQGFVNDRNALTLWSTSRRALKGDTFTLQWDKPCTVSRIVFIPEKQETLPRDFTLWITEDGRAWKRFRQYHDNIGPVFYSVFHPFVKIVKPRMELALEDVKICGIRITLDKEAPLFPVSLREIYLYEKTGEIGKERYEQEAEAVIAEVKKVLREDGVVIADHWFESFFYKEGFKVEFTPNWSVNNYGMDNPHLLSLIPVDFTKTEHLLISEKNHSPQTEQILAACQIPFQKKAFGCFDVLSIPKVSGTPSPVYWDGLQLLSLSASAIKYPDFKDLVSGSTPLDLTFGEMFKLNSFALSQDRDKMQLFFDLQVLKRIEKDYYLFIHFCDEQGNILFQGDFLPSGALGDARNWIPLKSVLVENTIPVPASAHGKKGKIMIGMWNPEEGKNLRFNSSKETRFTLCSWEI